MRYIKAPWVQVRFCLALSIFFGMIGLRADELTEVEKQLATNHPRPSYEEVEDIDAMARALRKSLANADRQSFSRGWWKWDRLRARYVDGGRVAKKELQILEAVFRGLILDWYDKLLAQGEDDLFYIYFVTTAPGNKVVRELNGRQLVRDLHGGGYHGGWGGAARMRIYKELADSGLLTDEDQQRFRKIVYQSMNARFLDFEKGSQSADNHSYGNGGGVALALKYFPEAPQAREAQAWLDRIWKHLADFGDWREWTYYPYGPIFLHGLLDIAEANGKIDEEAELIEAIAQRALAFIHGNGVHGHPNAGARMRADMDELYNDPWNVGYYQVEQSARDGHFWYRLAQHYPRPEYLWAAEQVALGGKPPSGKVSPAYEAAYQKRFFWFEQRGLKPGSPQKGASVGYLSPLKQRIPERIYLNSGREPGDPFAAFFLYDQKSAHLDNVSGHLYEYTVHGAKFLHSSGKYNNVYGAGDILRGGGTGEESLDLLLVLHGRHPFPLHPDRQGDERDFMRRGSLRHQPERLKVESRPEGDSFAQYAYDHYYGTQSRWTRRVVLTREGYLIVADEFVGDPALGEAYLAGPVWHLARWEEARDGLQENSWFRAPAMAHAWWQEKPHEVVLYFHDDQRLKFGSLKQAHSQDTNPNITTFAYRSIAGGKPESFLSVFVPCHANKPDEEVLRRITTSRVNDSQWLVQIGFARVLIPDDGTWQVSR